MSNKVSGNIVDVLGGIIYPGSVEWTGEGITAISRDRKTYHRYIIPGFIDAHIHIESTMLVPSEFAWAAIPHGTVAAVSDPHEIGNVLGVDGIDFMVGNGRKVPLKFFFGAPSCVPATPFETSGAALGVGEVEALLARDEIGYLSEVMNFPAVLAGDREVMGKIRAAQGMGKRIDGHAPGLTGDALHRYIEAGITTDHESLTRGEAEEKLRWGMAILIREGSAARVFDSFITLLHAYPQGIMFCSDDLHADDLLRGHINLLVKRAVAAGVDVMKVLRAASVNPVLHYGLPVGLLREGDPADFIVVDSLKGFVVETVVIGGVVAAEKGAPCFKRPPVKRVNTFEAREKSPEDFSVPARGRYMKVIDVFDGQLLTERFTTAPCVQEGQAVGDRGRDILKIAVINRYRDDRPAVAFVRGFGLREGALASSVAHDSHNIVAVGVTDEDICRAVNLVIEHKGGIAAVSGAMKDLLPLPVAGIMSDRNAQGVARAYGRLNQQAKKGLGCPLAAPFMTLSFMALPVIPKLRITDKGLFDGETFTFTDLFLP